MKIKCFINQKAFEEMYSACINPYAALQTEDKVTGCQTDTLTTLGIRAWFDSQFTFSTSMKPLFLKYNIFMFLAVTPSVRT